MTDGPPNSVSEMIQTVFFLPTTTNNFDTQQPMAPISPNVELICWSSSHLVINLPQTFIWTREWCTFLHPIPIPLVSHLVLRVVTVKMKRLIVVLVADSAQSYVIPFYTFHLVDETLLVVSSSSTLLLLLLLVYFGIESDGFSFLLLLLRHWTGRHALGSRPAQRDKETNSPICISSRPPELHSYSYPGLARWIVDGYTYLF